MKYHYSPHIAVQVKNYAEAIKFYRDVLGMEVVYQDDNETEFKCGPVSYHIENNDQGKVFFEFKVEDIDTAKSQLEAAGCNLVETSTPEGLKSFMAVDPYGMRFHIWQED
jgi:catechol 2,3-dioxygenase-like lactoylglutathione lyase family enzyme